MATGKLRRRLAAGTGVAIATTGLSNCNDNGAVDPPPPPLECTLVDEGESLDAAGSVVGTTLLIRIRHREELGGAPASWESAQVTNAVGAAVTSIDVGSDSIGVTLTLDADTVTAGSFTLQGVLRGYSGMPCSLRRTFQFQIQGGAVVLTHLTLPLGARHHAWIAAGEPRGHRLALRARTAYRGSWEAYWTVTAGSVTPVRGDHVTWILPQEPGVYQAEMVADYGADGVGFDAIRLVVSREA